MIRLENLTKRYGSFTAVDRIDLRVENGEIFGFIGPNGAGKTTTIKMMGGLVLPSEGSIHIDGISMAAAPETVKARVGLIPDRPFLYEKLTGMEFLRFTADLYGVPEAEVRSRATEVLEIFSLQDRGAELIESFSHGMKQRLIMAAALLHRPRLIIVDEPMVGLDPRGIKMVRGLFRRLSRAEGTTIFMSTHTLKLAEDVCDRIGIIHRGRLIATGTVGELRRAADVGEADLEAVFLQLTAEEQSGPAAA